MSAPADHTGSPRWWHLKRRVFQDPIALAAPLRTELGNRPHTQVILAGRGIDSAQKATGWLIAILVAAFFGVAVAERLWTLALITGVLTTLLGFAAWIVYQRAAMSWSATWHRDHVVVQDGRYWRTRTWEESLDLFEGVARRYGYLSQGNELMPGVRVHGVVLEHPAPHKSVLLHAQRQPITDELLVDYAWRLRTRVIN